MRRILFWSFVLLLFACKKKDNSSPPITPALFDLAGVAVNGNSGGLTYYGVSTTPTIRLSFTTPVDRSTMANGITLTNTSNGAQIPLQYSNTANDSVVVLQPSTSLLPLTKYTVTIGTTLKSAQQAGFVNTTRVGLVTAIDSTDKFPQLSDSALLDLVQRQTLKYFWDFGHPVSGLARERNTSGDVVTTGGSGFGIMAIIAGIHRNFISRGEGLARIQTMVSFLKNKVPDLHGAFPHWLNGTTGAVVPFSTKDNGADLVETSYLVEGLLCARQFFTSADMAETALRNDIGTLWSKVQWSWFRRNNENVLYWHWSPDYMWDMNMPVRGWNEALITYVVAASSPTYSIPKVVYDNGWAQNGAIRNGNTYYGYVLPVGEPLGGPLFFEHYSFMGINPFGLSDAYANYQMQVVNHTKINYEYCKANPRGYYGYSSQCWGLTASDIPNGYTASSPTNDIGVIAPTAALSSMPYTPAESMQALRFFYYKLGDKLWGPYGFYDAFSLKDTWFANSYLAIDQGPIVAMIENYRSGLLWNLFTSDPDVKAGLRKLGFAAPYL